MVMPARNADATIGAAIESILSQDFQDFEFILVDHKSDDVTPALMAQAAEADSRIQIYECNDTFVEAANLAWHNAAGEYIARMDSDDVAYPQRLSQQLSYLKQHPSLSACGSLVSICKRNGNGAKIPPDDGYQRYESWINSVITPEEIRRQRFVDSPIPNPTTMIRRSSLVSSGGYHDPPWAEDYDFWLRLLEGGNEIGKVPEVLLDWYDSPVRSTRTIARYQTDQFQNAKAHFLSRMPNLKRDGVAICGAGPIGKEMARLLADRDILTSYFLEVNQRQIGQKISGIPVIDHATLNGLPREMTILSAVGNRTSRERIAELVTAAGWVEGENFFSVA